MKLISVLLLAIVALHSTTANPFAPALFDTFGKVASGVGGTVDGFIKGGQTAFSGAVDVATGIVKGSVGIGTGIASGVTNTISGVVVQSSNVFKDISQTICSTIKNSINQFTSGFVKRAADSFEKTVEKVQGLAENVLKQAEEKLDELRKRSDESIQKVESNLNDWAVVQQRKADRSSYQVQAEVQDILSAFVDESIRNTQTCADSIATPIEDVITKAKSTAEDTFPIIDGVIAKIQECASINKVNVSDASKCANEIREQMKLLAPLPAQYGDLMRQVGKTSIDSLSKSKCMKDIESQVKSQQQAAQQRVDAIISSA